MAVKYLSNKFKDLQVGITNYSENKGSSLYVVGNVGVGTNDATAEVGISNTSVLAVGILTAYRIYSSVYGEFTGAFSGSTVDTNSLNVTGISTLGTVKVSGGIVTATAGVVTYYGDGQYLTGVAATERVDTKSLNVSGLSTFTDDINANGNIIGDGATNISGISSLTLDYGIYHTGDTATSISFENGVISLVSNGNTLLNVSNVIGGTQVNDNLLVSGNAHVTGVTTLAGTTTTGNLSVSGVSTFTGAIDANGTLDVDGQTSLDDLVVTGVATFNNTVTLASLLDCNGGADIDTLTAATAKISDLTQNRIVIAGASGELADNANLTYTSSLLNVGTDLNVVGSTTSAHLAVTGFSTFTGPIDCNTGADISGAALNVSAGLVANSAQISDLTDNRIVIVGNSGELEDSSDLTFDGSTFAVTGDATFSGNVSIAGTLTKEDVTNVDSIGLITARSGVRITGGGLNVVGVSTFAGNIDANGDLDVDGHTELDNLNVSGLSTFGGQLKIDGDILVDTPHVLQFGHSSQQAYIYHTSSNLMVSNIVGDVYITTSDDDKDIKIQTDNGSGGLANYFLADGSTGEAILYHYGSEKIKTSSSGAIVTGVLTATSFSGDGSGLTNVGGTGLWVSNSVGIHTTVDVGIGTTNPSLPVTIGNTAKLSVGIVSTYNLYAKDVNVSGDSTLTGDTFVGSAITMYASTGIVSATSFYGEGSNLTDVSWGSSQGGSFITEGSQTAVGGDPGDWQVIAGYYAGCCANNNTHNNVIFGKSAGRKLVDGERNVLIGDEVGCGLTTGMRNIFMGADVAKESTTGDYNIGLGYKTLRTSTGSCNIAIGFCAADGNTSGTNNVIIGKNANSDVGVGGTDNVWIGTDSGGYASGCCNTFVGAYSGYGVYNGTFNVGLGYQAGKSVIQQSAHHNISIGTKAGLLGTTGSCNVFVGVCAGRSVSTGDFNLFAGYKAGDAVTVGTRNVYLGNCAGAGSTDGHRNIAIGNFSGWLNTTGCCNVYIGSCAGTYNCTGSNNIAIGRCSGFAANSTSNNTFIGDSSGSKLTLGEGNVFLGSNTGLEATNAGCNVFIGNNAGQGNTNVPILGGCNIAVGAFAGYHIKGGDDNVFLGTRAGKSSDDSNRNVFLGYYAGSLNTGHCNIFIGPLAGNTNTIGVSNVAIGPAVCLPSATGNNQLAIGSGSSNWISGDSSYNVTLAGIVTAYASGIVSATSYYGDGSNLTNVGGGTLIEGITVKEEGTTVGTAGEIKTLDFLGGTVTATGSGTTATITIAGAGTTDGWTQDAQGNLFAGTDSGKARDADTCFNIGIGQSAGKALNAGDYNVFLGKDAGCSITSASYNTFIGKGAGQLTRGGWNTNIGYGAGCGSGTDGTCTGGDNVFVGTYVGAKIKGGSYNTAVGDISAYELTSGSNNLFLGRCAGQNVTTGSNNIAIGCLVYSPSATGSTTLAIGSGTDRWIAGDSSFNTTISGIATVYAATGIVSATKFCGDGSCLSGVGFSPDAQENLYAGTSAGCCSNTHACFNVAIGYTAGSKLGAGGASWGQNNVFIGKCAGAVDTNGLCNTFIGGESGKNNINGFYNTFLGYSSGSSNSSANGNVYIGFRAGSNANAYCNTFLGACSGKGATGACNVVIGQHVSLANNSGAYQLAIGSGDNNWIDGDANFNVGIGTNTTDAVGVGVTAKLSVGIVSTYQLYAAQVDINNGTIDGTNIGVSHRSNANFNYVDISETLGVTGQTTLTNLNVAGIVTATSFSGDGSNLVGVAKSTVLEDAGIHTSGTTTLNHFVVTGISTFGNSIAVTGTASATDFNSTSDIRLKTNIKRIEDPLAKVVRIEGVTFDWKEWNRPALGVIADQVQEVIPELVQGTDPKTVNYNGLIGLLIEAVKEQQTQIDDLKSRLSKLE